jgi:hypothetical protein
LLKRYSPLTANSSAWGFSFSLQKRGSDHGPSAGKIDNVPSESLLIIGVSDPGVYVMIIEDVAKVGIIVHAPSGEILISQVPAFGAVGGNKKTKHEIQDRGGGDLENHSRVRDRTYCPPGP